MRVWGKLGLRLLLEALACLPWRTHRPLASAVASLLIWRGSRSARVTRRNLELCFPALSREEREALARRSLTETVVTALELPRVCLRSCAGIRRRIVRIEGREHVEQARRAGKGLLILAPHLGNWEVLGLYLAELGRTHILYKPPRRPGLDRLLRAARARAGASVVPTTRSGVAALLRALRRDELAAVLPDQEPPLRSGVFAPFFGVPALTVRLVHGLCRRSGCRAVMAWCERVPGGFAIRFRPVEPALYDADPKTSAAALNRSIEDCVRCAPEQYQWEYRRFSTPAPGAAKLYVRRPQNA